MALLLNCSSKEGPGSKTEPNWVQSSSFVLAHCKYVSPDRPTAVANYKSLGNPRFWVGAGSMCVLMQEIWKQVRNMKYKDLHIETDSQVHMTMYVHVCNVFACTITVLLYSLSGIKCVWQVTVFSCDYYAIPVPMTINMKTRIIIILINASQDWFRDFLKKKSRQWLIDS